MCAGLNLPLAQQSPGDFFPLISVPCSVGTPSFLQMFTLGLLELFLAVPYWKVILSQLLSVTSVAAVF